MYKNFEKCQKYNHPHAYEITKEACHFCSEKPEADEKHPTYLCNADALGISRCFGNVCVPCYTKVKDIIQDNTEMPEEDKANSDDVSNQIDIPKENKGDYKFDNE